MILQALTRHYDALADRGEISPAGWGMAKVSFALELTEDGALRGVVPMKILSPDGKKELPQPMRVPEQVKRSSGVAANFLCDNSSYFLGIDEKGKPQRTRQCFDAAKALHHAILDGVESDAVQTVLRFFDTWQPETAREHPELAGKLDELLAGANLIFKLKDGRNLQEDAAVKAAWARHRAQSSADAVTMRCLVTGETAPVARLHPSVKGVRGAQSSGASLVSYNAPSMESFGHEQDDDTGQGFNAPVSESAAFKYGTALNFMTADRPHVQHTADTTVLFWAENAEPAYQDLFSVGLFDAGDDVLTNEDLKGIVRALAHGGDTVYHDTALQPGTPFYVLGLAPNASRLSVRFFLQNRFGDTLANLHAHNERLEIIRPAFETKTRLPLWELLNETANQNAKTKMPPPPMSGAVLRAILTGGDYPASLFETVMLRIRAEHDIGWKKAAVLKAYFLKNRGVTVPKEVLQVELNEKSGDTPYVLGRLFAVLEMVQKSASPGIKATIRNKYFTSAAATPSVVFPLLLHLSQHHQAKLQEGSKIYYDKKITALAGNLGTVLPAHFTLQEQGTFYLGYYHEKQALFTSGKEDKTVQEEQKHE